MLRKSPKKTGLLGLFALLLLLPVAALSAPVFDPVLQPTGYVMQPALSKYNLTSGNEVSYHTTFDKGYGTGDVYAYPINARAEVDQAAEFWLGASSHIDVADWDTERRIVTFNGTGVPFRYDSLSATQRSSLAATVTAQQAYVDFIRGDHSNEVPAAMGLRPRYSRLGEIVHSRPYLSTDGLLYVGANDGMLHVFNATNDAATAAGFIPGDEVWAYIPSMLIGKLNKLGTDPYDRDFYVDGPVSFALAAGGTKKYLVGMLGAGGKGFYYIDITDPYPSNETEAAAFIKGEFTPAKTGFANLGYTYGSPAITKVQYQEGFVTMTVDAIIVGNGYLNGGNGHSSLYVINLENGNLIKEIDTGYGTTTSPAGLSSPTAVDAYWSDPPADGSDSTYHYANDGITDFVYAGDIDGNMWKFDLTNKNRANWTATRIFYTGKAITSAPAVSRHLKAPRYTPDGSGGYTLSSTAYMVNFATGRILTPADADDATSVYAAYGVWDGAPTANTTLMSQTLTARDYDSNTPVRTATYYTPNWTVNGDIGWRTPLPAGERVVGDGTFVSAGRFYFTSTNPTVTNPSPEPPRGENWLNELDFMTGGGAINPFLDLSKDQLLNNLDRVPGFTGVNSVPVSKYLGPGVFSQPLVVQLDVLNQTLFNSNPDSTPPPTPEDLGMAGGHFDFDIFKNYTVRGEPETFCTRVEQVDSVWDPTGGRRGRGTWVAVYGCTRTATGTCTRWSTSNGIDYCREYTSTVSDNFDYTHVHKYDDTYDVTGVNMLNASNISYNLGRVITSNTTQFKVIVMNQRLNPSAKLAIGSGGVFTDAINVTTGASLDLAALPTYTMADIGQLVVNMPVDGFLEKQWLLNYGITDKRPGLIPTQWDCVVKGFGGTRGANGEWRNGALTIQVIKAATPNTAIQQNVSGDWTLGFRVKDDFVGNYVLAEYSIYWHHKSSYACYGDSDWKVLPGPDTVHDTVTVRTPAAGSADPKDGDFTPPSGDIVSITTVKTDNVTTTTTTYVDGATKVVTKTRNDDGTVTIRTVFTDASGNILQDDTVVLPDPEGTLATGGEEAKTMARGRISWQQLEN